MLTWTPALAIGIPILDAQHQELFRRADGFLEALGDRRRDDVERLLAFLREHAAAHFAAEEEWMREAGYPELEAHRAEHARFAARLEEYASGSAGGAEPGEVATWLVRWLHEHVVRADTAAARFVRSRPGGPGGAP